MTAQGHLDVMERSGCDMAETIANHLDKFLRRVGIVIIMATNIVAICFYSL